jgi:hypothetical protein
MNSSESRRSRSAGSSVVAARCATARRRHIYVGVLGYSIPSVVLAIGIRELVRRLGGDLSLPVMGMVIVSILAIPLWRGATVAAVVRPDGLLVRNRWRRIVVPWDRVVSAEIAMSGSYSTLDLAEDLRALFTSEPTLGVEEFEQQNDVLKVTRRGRRRRLPVYATLGLTLHLDTMQPFLDALSAHGVQVVRTQPSGADGEPASH